MTNILNSASKLVFIAMAAALIGLTLLGIVDAKDFVAAAMMAFTFYFSSKGESSKPYAGK